MKIIANFEACEECYYFAANGCHHEERPCQGDKIDAYHAGAPYMPVAARLVAGDDITPFSWARCQCCGSPLGGSRHAVAVLA